MLSQSFDKGRKLVGEGFSGTSKCPDLLRKLSQTSRHQTRNLFLISFLEHVSCSHFMVMSTLNHWLPQRATGLEAGGGVTH